MFTFPDPDGSLWELLKSDKPIVLNVRASDFPVVLLACSELLKEAAEEMESVPDSLVKAYHMCNDLAEKADNEQTKT